MKNASGTTRAVLIFAAFALVGVAALIPVVANPRPAPREIVLVARDMTFYLEGSDVANPTLVVRPGEEVRVTVRNQEPGITHAFGIASRNAAIERVLPGAAESALLRAPSAPGRYEYVCPPHAQMMRGVLLVTN